MSLCSMTGNTSGVAVAEPMAMFWGRLHRAGAKRGVLYGHGRDQNGQTLLTVYNVGKEGLADEGIPLVSADLAGARAWGNPTSVARVGDARTFLDSKLAPKNDKVLLYGGSMGSLALLNWARANKASVAAIALFLPIVDLDAVHGYAPYAADIEAAYGGSLAAFNAAKDASNPMAHVEDYEDIPIKLWYSTTDPIATPEPVAVFKAAVGANVELASMGAQNHTLNNFYAQEVVDFLAAYA